MPHPELPHTPVNDIEAGNGRLSTKDAAVSTETEKAGELLFNLAIEQILKGMQLQAERYCGNDSKPTFLVLHISPAFQAYRMISMRAKRPLRP